MHLKNLGEGQIFGEKTWNMERKQSSGFCRIFTVAFDRLFKAMKLAPLS